MPELPEVETVRRGLARAVVGRRFEHVEVGRDRTVRRTSAGAVVAGLTGTRVLAANRRGKYLLLPLDSGDELMIHLRMTGQVRIEPIGTPRPPHTHVVARLDDGNEMWFVDPRTFGEVVVFDPDHIAVEVPELVTLGPDPISEGLTLAQLRVIVRGRRRQLKPFLLDQSQIAGIGNIYADEILHLARLRPERLTDTLTRRNEVALHAAIHRVLLDAIEAGGSTLRDNKYVNLEGATGSYQVDHAVYGREGERCLTCGRGWIRRVVLGQRSTHFCAICQR